MDRCPLTWNAEAWTQASAALPQVPGPHHLSLTHSEAVCSHVRASVAQLVPLAFMVHNELCEVAPGTVDLRQPFCAHLSAGPLDMFCRLFYS